MFKSKNFCHIASNNRNTVKVGVFVYRTADDLDTVTSSGYFNERIIDINLHDLIIHEQIDATDNTKVVRNVLCVTERTLDNVNTIVVKSKWEGDIEQEIEDLRTYVDNTFVKKDGSSIMSGPLKFIAGSYSGAIAGGLGDGIEIYKINSSGTIQSEVASLTLTNGFLPGTNNTMNIGSSSRKWKDAYISRVITSVLNNGANISIPTTSGTMALTSDIAIKSTEANIVNPTAGQWLQYNGTKWENISLTPANTDLSNLSSTGANIGNWSSNVSNCLVEIPQDLNIVLSSGSLIVKAGSKGYLPDGTAVSVANDITVTASSTLTRMLFLNSTGTGVDYINVNLCYSGATAPTVTGTARWFDTANNLMKQTTDSGATWTTLNETFPIAIFHTTSGSIDSVQVFNGFGYIGSTVFSLSGIKGLIPNGRNADGTLKSTQIVSSSIFTRTRTSDSNYHDLSLATNGIGLNTNTYNEEENFVYNSGGTKMTDRVGFGTVEYEHTAPYKITALKIKRVFHAVDYNDFADNIATLDSSVVKLTGNQTIGGNKSFTGTTTAVTPAASDNSTNVATTAWVQAHGVLIESQEPTVDNDYTWYRKYSDGWVEQGGIYNPSSSESSHTINLPVAMADAHYNLQITIIDDSGSSAPTYYSVGARTKSSTSFTLYGQASLQKDWKVSGKAA